MNKNTNDKDPKGCTAEDKNTDTFLENADKIEKTVSYYIKKHGEFPSVSYLSKATGLHRVTISKHLKKMNGAIFPVAVVGAAVGGVAVAGAGAGAAVVGAAVGGAVVGEAVVEAVGGAVVGEAVVEAVGGAVVEEAVGVVVVAAAVGGVVAVGYGAGLLVAEAAIREEAVRGLAAAAA
eukprot:COSAG01_NODE_93_length_27013_cov_41.515791_15_plen_178_part_00